MLASGSGDLEVARLLVEAGAEKNCRDDHGRTALMLASASGRLEVARMLVEAGAQQSVSA